MRKTSLIMACSLAAMLLGGCATFGTNIKGDFTCRAPKGDCSPTHVIDERAAAALEEGASHHALAPIRSGVAGGDASRTSERTLKIVFPAHVDEAGNLHDEAVAWAVVENPRWSAELRRKAGEDTAPPLMRALRRQLKAAQDPSEPDATGQTDALSDNVDSDAFSPFAPAADAGAPVPASPIPVASPLVLPSTAREANAGVPAPAAGGFDMAPPPHDRTPRPHGAPAPLTFPSIEAIEAAKAQARQPAPPNTAAPATPDQERK